jgi:hypothetical protein
MTESNSVEIALYGWEKAQRSGALLKLLKYRLQFIARPSGSIRPN